MIEWGRMLETLIAAGAGAAAVVFIDWMVKFYLYKKRNFKEAISIQLALHQMLVRSLEIRKLYNDVKTESQKNYEQKKLNDPENVWCNFRHIDFPEYLNTFDVIKFDWDFTQFLSHKEDETRNILRYLIPAKLGYQSLMSIIKKRNEWLWRALQKIELVRSANEVANNFEYINDNLRKAIGLPVNEKLRGITDLYIEKIDEVIIGCSEAFSALSKYIHEHFCHSMPYSLDISDDLKQILSQVVDSENKTSNK